MTEAADAAVDFAAFIEKFQTQVPGGPEGDAIMRQRDPHPFIDTTAADIRPDTLDDDQIDSWFNYMSWNLWELMASRSTEGESGLIPRQEYESLSFVQQWAVYPDVMRMVTEKIGVDGLVDLGKVSKREVGTKVNHLRNYASALMALLGRGVGVTLDLVNPADSRADVETCIQFGRRLWHGTWGDGPGLASGHDFKLRHLDRGVLDPLVAQAVSVEDPEYRAAFRRFNATTELFGFMLHYDNRLGMGDTGPYPLPGGGFALVRDHFLHESAYPWATVAEGMPYAVTEVMVFRDENIDVTINDIGTTFTTPSTYLDSLDSVVVFARDTIDTPMSELRVVDRDEMKRIAVQAEKGVLDLYRMYARKSVDEKIWDGITVYSHDFFRPIAHRIGMWDEIRTQGFDEPAELTKQAWPLLTDGKAPAILGPVFITGAGFPSVRPQ
ncbi:hypothetical protein IA539_03895 [Gordonia sp. zg691]|uniref:hypothetical protein n=1 Tax=Gordonia jinghuaiqii TaxID=2758710 RepID=UPI00166237A8|nr:hypothetical protein [Gordonia jinghuaiqii]MBD0860351.1 hypothetical protein [Gordonia jinghuaiqii]